MLFQNMNNETICNFEDKKCLILGKSRLKLGNLLLFNETTYCGIYLDLYHIELKISRSIFFWIRNLKFFNMIFIYFEMIPW